MNHVDANDRDDCPPSLILDQFLSGSLHAEHEERINQHVEACPVCAAKIAGNDDDSELERLLLAPTETPVVSLQDADDLLARVKRPAGSVPRGVEPTGGFASPTKRSPGVGWGLSTKALISRWTAQWP